VAGADAGIVTQILSAAAEGDPRASADLLPLVYEELRSLAKARLAKTPPGNTLEPTALVHEAYLRLLGGAEAGWNGRGHFFGAAAQAMRQILVEQARRKASQKHGGDARRVDFDSQEAFITPPSDDILALDEALSELETHDPRKADIIKLRYFAGLTTDETAAALNVSASTVEREWRFARLLLFDRLRQAPPPERE